MRKALAGRLIRLAHFIYLPRVTESVDSGPLANMEAARKYYAEAWRESRGY